LAARNNKRALEIIRKLHNRQKNQSDKIDIICRDIVAAHREFATKLAKLKFVTSYYESLLQSAGLSELLDAAVLGIRESITEADAAVFLLSDNGFDVHISDTGGSDSVEKKEFQHWFSRELVSSVSQMNRICSLEQLLKMGLQGPPAILKTISIAAIPLGRFGRGLGFVLVYRPAYRPLQADELSRVAAISVGLREAIGSFQESRAKPFNTSLHL
jgi:hypothetical protein